MKAELEQTIASTIDQILGYLNFASGSHDPRFFAALNDLFCYYSTGTLELDRPESAAPSLPETDRTPTYRTVENELKARLTRLSGTSETYRDASQAQKVLDIAFGQVLPAYLHHHRDLLFHQRDEQMFNSFFVGRVLETVLQFHETDHADEIVAATLNKLNSFIGHRPVATLEDHRVELYAYERVCPIPIYVREAGVAYGPYSELLGHAIKILTETHPDILRAAQFNPDHLEELAIDPRAYDFDHPINKRPNHHFGHWDEHAIDRKGNYFRFIVHQVLLDALLERMERDSAAPWSLPRAELMVEASTVLAGTILMGSGITGGSPGSYDSNTNLNDLVYLIAHYRDQFYEQATQRLTPKHFKRIQQEARLRQQPLGAARQDINAQLARLRAKQLVNCRLASIFARMGYAQAAEQQSAIVPVAAARISCQIECLIDAASRAVAGGDLQTAAEKIPEIMDCLKRGIENGSIVDPWNILGFDGNYSLFPAIENTVADHRVFELIDLMERLFAICSRIWSEAAANNDTAMMESIKTEFHRIVTWWRQFAAHEVVSVEAVDADEVFAAAQLVAEALNLWHLGGAAAGDIEFWAQHAEMFDSPKAYSLVIEALMQRADYSTSTALLIHWLSQSEEIPLQMADSSFHELVFHWISEQRRLLFEMQSGSIDPPVSLAPNRRIDNSPNEIWNRIRKFYDFMEANADDYWSVPEFELQPRSAAGEAEDSSDSPLIEKEDEAWEQDDNDSFNLFADDDEEYGEEELSDSTGDLFGAAYDEMTYRDTTDDGHEGEVFDGSLTSDDELEAEVQRLLDRLEFLSTIASYWAVAASIPLPVVRKEELDDELSDRLRKRREIFRHWVDQATLNLSKLKELMESISKKFPLPLEGSDYEAMLHYDQLRLYKDTLLEQAILTSIETENANRMLLAVVTAVDWLLNDSNDEVSPEDGSEADVFNSSDPFVTIFAHVILQHTDDVRKLCQPLADYLNRQALLYVPLVRGGQPDSIVKTRILQIALLELMRHLPALGLFVEAYQLLRTALTMERKNTVGTGAVTEFDELFEVGFTAMVHTLIDSTNQFKADQEIADPENQPASRADAETLLFSCTEKLAESMLAIWLEHSQTLRISVMEKVRDQRSWDRLVEFIQTYGEGLFTQQFLHLGNVRGILHQGVDHWLKQLIDSPDQPDLKLLNEMGTELAMPKAVRYLKLVLEAVVENYNEYRDYNSTTTQSDHGECLYMFLDFLRLLSRYDRICWNLKPVIWAHSIFVENQQASVARRWRRLLTERLGSEAEKYLRMLERLRVKYSMRMESVGRRLEGRFAHQMQIDRLVSLVAPAMKDPSSPESRRRFEMLQQQAQTFTRSTNGVGIDLPAWLAALESEVEQFQFLQRFKVADDDPPWPETAKVSIEQLQDQLNELPGRPIFE